MQRLTDAADPDLGARFAGVRPAWEAIQFTGYGEAVRLLASEVYGMEDWSAAALHRAEEKLRQWQQPGGRYQLLRQVGKLDHVQVDDFCWPCLPDPSGPDFFLYDLSWASFGNGQIDAEGLCRETGGTVSSLSSLRQGMEQLFAKYAPCAVAVKAQHAYNRTLCWQERGDDEAENALQVVLAHKELMHIAYPYSDELVALTKHYRNVWADLCWAWSIAPYTAADFVRRFLHAAPASKLFAFGGDTRWPTSSVAYALQARRWFHYALQGEVGDGLLLERQAMDLATRLMRLNQEECFDLKGTRAAIGAARA